MICRTLHPKHELPKCAAREKARRRAANRTPQQGSSQSGKSCYKGAAEACRQDVLAATMVTRGGAAR